MSTLIPAEARKKIEAVRDQLLEFHKLLLEREKTAYEQTHGPILSRGEYLNLVLGHSQFEWLRQLSGLIVQIDEMLAPRSTAGPAEADAVLEEIRTLMNENSEDPFAQHLRTAMLESNTVGTAHFEILRTLASQL